MKKILLSSIVILLCGCYTSRPYYIVNAIEYDSRRIGMSDYYIGTKVGKESIVILDSAGKYMVADTIFRNSNLK